MPVAMASRITRPKVSVQLGNTNTSASRKQRASSSPKRAPRNFASGYFCASSARAELQDKYPEARFLGAKFGEDLARCFKDADVFVFPSWTDTFGLVILEAMGTGTPVAAYPAHGPIDIIPGSNAGAIDDDLKTACLKCLEIDRKAVRAYAEQFSWRASAEQFLENLKPYPEPEKARFWRRIRRLARLRKRAA